MPVSRSWIWVVALIAAVGCENAPRDPHTVTPHPRDASTLADRDAAQLNDAGRPPQPRLARNIIVVMGDGMGPEQLAAGRFAKGGQLQLDALKGPALAITDSLTTWRLIDEGAPATDSAAAATVIATGTLVENDVLSLGPNGERYETVLEVAKRAGKATGLVTTSYFFDASPSAFAVHQPSRSFYPEIGREMLGLTQPDVVMGAGQWLLDDLTTGVLDVARQSGYRIVRGAAALDAWDPSRDLRLLGLFETRFVPVVTGGEHFTMTPALERSGDCPDPTLATMTRRALERLSRAPSGFFLFAEGELTDEISHRGPSEVAWANRALPAQVDAIDATVAVAIDWVQTHSSFEETLLVVLADHETGGYHFDHALGPQNGDFTAFTQDADGLRTGFHTRTPIEVYALGPGSDSLQRVTQHADTHRLLLGTL